MKTLIMILCLCAANICVAQKEGTKWYFGEKAGLDFTTGAPIALHDGKTGTDAGFYLQEGTACISDSVGNLLFYTGGRTIWNRYHNPMPNGTGLMGGPSATQSSIIIPKPGSTNLFYVFTADEFQSYPNNRKGYRYSVVDMCLNNGNGDVVPEAKNILLVDSATEKLAACEDALGTGYWVMGHKLFSNAFYAWHVTSSGISAPVISEIGTIHGRVLSPPSWSSSQAQGQIKFNNQGTKLAVTMGNYDPSFVDLFDFNKATGVVSNFCHNAIDSGLGKRSFGVEFSPNGKKLYLGVDGGYGGKILYQYSIEPGADCNSFINSKFKIDQREAGYFAGGLQLAPDNKIYLVYNTSMDLSCINSPDSSGVAVNFTLSAISLSPGTSHYTLPTFIANYRYRSTAPCTTVPVTLDKLQVVIHESSVICKWRTLQEMNSSHFVIQRSIDGINFLYAGTVAAAGNSSVSRNYSFEDHTAFNQTRLHYRLQMVDRDGKFSYSNIVRVDKISGSELKIFSNPVKQRLSFNFHSPINGNAVVSIVTSSGKKVYNHSVSLRKGNNLLSINTSNFSTGVYILSVESNGKLSRGKFVKVVN
jgi:hypothetical protein